MLMKLDPGAEAFTMATIQGQNDKTRINLETGAIKAISQDSSVMESRVHITVFKRDHIPQVTRCTTCCKLFHCPVCPRTKFKPRYEAHVLKHVALHANGAVQHEDFLITRCHHACRSGSSGHFHCPVCLMTIVRRLDFRRHLQVCSGPASNQGDGQGNEVEKTEEEEMEVTPSAISEDKAANATPAGDSSATPLKEPKEDVKSQLGADATCTEEQVNRKITVKKKQNAPDDGRKVSDVEERVRFLREQYGRTLLKPLPEPRYAAKKKPLRKLNYLKPFIQRKCTTYTSALDMEQRCEDEEEVENQEGKDDVFQETGSMYVSPIDYNISDSEPVDEPKSLDSTPNTAALHQTPARHLNGEILPPDVNSQTVHKEAPVGQSGAGGQDNDNLHRFSQMTLTDMRQIKNPFILMRLRRDITNLVFQAVQDDSMHRRGRSLSFSTSNNGGCDRTRNNGGCDRTRNNGGCDRTWNKCNAGVAQPPPGSVLSGRWPPHPQGREEHDGRWKCEEAQKRRKREEEDVSWPPQRGEMEAERENETRTETPAQTLVIKTETDRYEIEIDSLILP